MSKDLFDIILLIALPASGKSEIRNFMSHIPPEELEKKFHIGENLQLDDFPYVFMMRRIDEELEKIGENRIFYPGETPFYDGRDWGTLVHLLNEDYADMVNHTMVSPESASIWLFNRIDRAALCAGISPRLALLKPEIKRKIASALEHESADLLHQKLSSYPDTMDGKTLIIECARGGADGASMPLTGTCGYQYTLPLFSPEILSRASILYVWVTPDESRRKNAERADPNDPGSNLHHSTPHEVMMYDYGCDDLAYLVSVSEAPGTVTVSAYDQKWVIPSGIFDNREDKTSFLREETDKWSPENLSDFSDAIQKTTDSMWLLYS